MGAKHCSNTATVICLFVFHNLQFPLISVSPIQSVCSVNVSIQGHVTLLFNAISEAKIEVRRLELHPGLPEEWKEPRDLGHCRWLSQEHWEEAGSETEPLGLESGRQDAAVVVPHCTSMPATALLMSTCETRTLAFKVRLQSAQSPELPQPHQEGCQGREKGRWPASTKQGWEGVAGEEERGKTESGRCRVCQRGVWVSVPDAVITPAIRQTLTHKHRESTFFKR